MFTERIERYETPRTTLTEGKILTLFKACRETEQYRQLNTREVVLMEDAFYNAKSIETFVAGALRIIGRDSIKQILDKEVVKKSLGNETVEQLLKTITIKEAE